MTWLQGRMIRFRLSSEGKQTLVGIFEKESFLGLVEIVDDLGVWIVVGKPTKGAKQSLMLLKWDYFATAVLDIEPVHEVEKLPLGFGA